VNDEPTYLSLFAGIGGLDLAAEAWGYRCGGQVEWDAACTRILERHWPGVPRWGDVAEFTAAAYADRRRVGLIVGGFPCQPVSTAGRRKAGHDARWLWPEFARVVGELRPRAILIENVRGLLSAGHVDPAAGEPVRGSAFGEVLGDLADIGYDATWTLLRASDVGACHQRARIFILAADADGCRSARGQGPLHLGPRRVPAADRSPARDPDDGRLGAALRSPDLTGQQASRAPGAEPRGADRGRAATDPQDADGRPGSSSRPQGEGLRRAGPRGGDTFPWGAYELAIRRWEAVTRPAPHPVDEKGRLDPAFVEWMMGFPAGWVEGMSRTQALKALGNAVVPQQAIGALQVLEHLEAVAV
jgi:DNA (cytosine-5)-methyltransferase 1